LARGRQVALGLGPLPEVLDAIHDLIVLSQEGIPYLLGPVESLIHHLEDRREVQHRLDARVPILLFQGHCELVTLQVRICLCPAGRLNDLQGIGGCHKDLHQKLIRIQSNGRKHLVKLFLTEKPLSARVLGLSHDPSGRYGHQ
jgi:hypothetical protein